VAAAKLLWLALPLAFAGCTQPAELTLSEAMKLCLHDGQPASVTRKSAIDTERGEITRSSDGARVAYFIDAAPDRSFILSEGPPMQGPSGPIRDLTWKDGNKGFVLERMAAGRNVFVVFRYSGVGAGQRRYALDLAHSVVNCNGQTR
jgi:hypothetical protein